MNPTRSVYRTADVHQLLAETVRHLADAREFYLHASRSVLDAEIRHAFAFSAEAQSALLQSLQQSVPAARLDGEQPPSVFAAIAGQFDGRRPQAAARELHALDMDLMQRIEALFANYPDMNVRAALKKHVLTIQRAGDATRRLALRNVA
ncbi:hypothetical protein DFR29_114132 [Tahibacter aquaticus]|uniref:DUF2383 domain-containing protein n=1 Tax=Tahibacter aquaticus TaxID=520092 RepID=A0A4R6YQB4_9GAMM|nr:hypothetical protein [Tahibacter aquaticus]TDR40080.1 hypothetical protein DFR29_114132 [Tahibacter aquaticus]